MTLISESQSWINVRLLILTVLQCLLFEWWKRKNASNVICSKQSLT